MSADGDRCLCPASLAVSMRAAARGELTEVLSCDHWVPEGQVLCACCTIGICGAVSYYEGSTHVFEHLSVEPVMPSIWVISVLGIERLGLN